jgi:bifunctional non-homologous end joining protein LigD
VKWPSALLDVYLRAPWPGPSPHVENEFFEVAPARSVATRRGELGVLRLLLGPAKFQTPGPRRRQVGQTLVAGRPNGLYAARMHRREAPGFVEPMLLASGSELPSDDAWWAELKLDGARGQLRVVDKVPALRTRRGRRCDGQFPEILAAATGLPDVILDGEIVLPGQDGGPDFAALRARLAARAGRVRVAAATRPALFYAFDVIWYQGRDLRRCPLFERRRTLESLPLSGAVALVDTHPGQAAAVLAFAREHLLEGVVVKHADSRYRCGRSTAWQKFKIRHPERVWVTAWLPGGRGELDRYWVGRPVDGRLVPSGEVSYGLTPDQACTLRDILHAADLGTRRGHGPRPVAPVVAMTVAGHGRRSGPLRDPVVTALDIDPSGFSPTGARGETE